MASEQPQEFSAEFKFEMVMEALQAEKHVAEICLELDIREAQLVRWIQEFLREAPGVFETDPIPL